MTTPQAVVDLFNENTRLTTELTRALAELAEARRALTEKQSAVDLLFKNHNAKRDALSKVAMAAKSYIANYGAYAPGQRGNIHMREFLEIAEQGLKGADNG